MENRESILVVDDDQEWLELCGVMLKAQGFEVMAAASGKKALAMIEEKAYDIVLTDLAMPPPDGREVIFGVKARRPETDAILMTATPSLDSAIAVLKDGAYDYIIKPFKQDYLMTVLRRCLEKRRSQKELSVEKHLREELETAYAELKRTEKLKEGFLARISHELNTPMASIQMAMTLLARDLEGNEKAAGRLKMAQGSAQRLQGILDDLLDFVNAQKPELELAPQRVVLKPLFEEIEEENQRLIESKKLKVVLIFPENLPEADGDPRLLKRAFRQLFLNAVHFNSMGATLEVKADLWESRLVITVRDEGEGIPADQREDIFDSFYQIADYMTRRVGGLGLGLAIVKKICEAHGGSITVESEPGKGSKFRVSLPAAGGA